MAPDEIKHIAGEAAKAAVQEMFLTMGVDTSNPKSLLEVQLDFAHNRKWRKSVETVQRQSLTAAVGILVSGIAGAIWLAISAKGGH